MSCDVGGSLRGEIYQLFCLLEKSLVRININRTANRHRWIGRVYQGVRDNLCQGTRQIIAVTSG